MLTLTKSLVALALAGGFGLQAEDFKPLMNVATQTWPEKQHIGVICNYNASRAELEALAAACKPGTVITVADVRTLDKVGHGVAALQQRLTDFMVLMPHDPVVRDGSFGAKVALAYLANGGIPTLGTTREAMTQGAVFAIGDATGGDLLVTDKLVGTVEVILPDRATFVGRKASMTLGEGVTLQVIAAE